MSDDKNDLRACGRCRKLENIPTFQWLKFDDVRRELCESCWCEVRAWFYGLRPLKEPGE